MEGETEGEKHQYVPLISPQLGSFPQTEAHALPGNGPFGSRALNTLSHTSQGIADIS